MLLSIEEIRGYRIAARDGKIGRLDDVFFDDRTWWLRYLVVDTGNWFFRHPVLLPPEEAGRPVYEERVVPVSVTRQEVEESPELSSDLPVHRQYETVLIGPPGLPLPAAPSVLFPGDPHLRSYREVDGYEVSARDESFGRVMDFLCQTSTWQVRYLVVDTGRWLSGRRVLVAAEWLTGVDYARRVVGVDLEADAIRQSPPFDYTQPVNRAYEMRLYDYYGRPVYWKTEE